MDIITKQARADAGGLVSILAPRRNARTVIETGLPAHVRAFLQRAGKLAKHTNVSVYAVGGFVRDLLLGRPNLDIDLVVEGDAIAFARAFAKENGGRAKVHERFGTAAVVFPDEFKLDVAMARTEYYKHPAALPTVQPSSIREDLFRRDFTINALALRLNADRFGELIDFYGGQRDLKERTIRVLHSRSFIDDPTRVFRAVRFEYRFGFRLGKETLTLIEDAVKLGLFHRLSGKRLLEELILVLSEENPRRIIKRLDGLNLLRFIHPALKRTNRLEALLKSVEAALDWYKAASPNWPGKHQPIEPWIVYFMALMDVLPANAMEEAANRLNVPGRVVQKIRVGHGAMRRLSRRLARKSPPRPADVYRMLEGLSDETVLLVMASSESEAGTRRLSAYLATNRYVRSSLTGKQLKEMGLKPGPQFKKILDRLLDARLNGEVTSEREERALVKRIVER